ncbi:MAG: integrase core domain-containing protein, partial [Bacteroidales bacterium]|nr:integrase core domain-containing protein [Bacteroidales bacterium]
QAQIIAENWRVEYNTYRPHSSLGYMTPEEFADNSGNCVRPTVLLHSQNGNYNQRITEEITKF